MAGSRVSIPMFSICIALGFLLMSWSCEGRDFLVGGSLASWSLPLPSEDYLIVWSQKQRLRIADSLLFKYDPKSESVLQVNKQDFEACKLSNATAKYDDGNTRVIMDRPGDIYFVSGTEDHCQKGLKVSFRVMSDHHRRRHHAPAPAPEPSPSPSTSLSPSPSPSPSSSSSSPGSSAPSPRKSGSSASHVSGLVMGLGISFVTMMVSV